MIHAAKLLRKLLQDRLHRHEDLVVLTAAYRLSPFRPAEWASLDG
jgi:hypothetical protein